MKKGNTTSGNRKKIKVLIIYRSVEGRDLLKRALLHCADIDVTGSSLSGSIGLMKVRDTHPDLVIMDAEMSDPAPSLLTKQLLSIQPEMGIILVTSHEPEKKIINQTISSLQNGAFDFIKKPYDMTEERELAVLQRRLVPKIRTFSIRRYSRLARIASGEINRQPQMNDSSMLSLQKKQEVFELIAIGVSTGGPEALSKILPLLPSSFPLPIVIVLHMPKFFTQSMAQELNKKSSLTVKEAEEGEFIQKGRVYLAQGGKHLILIRVEHDRFLLHLDDGPEVNGCKPSVDVFFNSIADGMKKKVIGILLSGMGEDGVKGISGLKAKGAVTIAQDAETSIVWGMPGGAVRAGVIDQVLPLGSIADRIKELTGS